MRRLVLILLIMLGLAPGVWVRAPAHVSVEGRALDVTQLALAPDIATATRGPLSITGAWELSAEHDFHGGYSALVARGDGALLAGNDRGWGLTFPIEKMAPISAPLDLQFIGRKRAHGFEHIDLEAMSWDATRDQLWIAYEHGNVIERVDADGSRQTTRPVAMKDWIRNRAAETLVQLADGRLLVISETPERSNKGMRYHEALIFPRDLFDPNNPPVIFRFVSHRNYRPVDATLLPGGKVAILLREAVFRLPPDFKTAVMVAEPKLIPSGGAWTGSLAFEMTSGSLTDNYEGVTWVADPYGKTQSAPQSGALYMISDDNFASFQRTLMVRLGSGE